MRARFTAPLALVTLALGCPTPADPDTGTGTDTPGVDVPGLDAPGADVPGLDAPGTDSPMGTDAPMAACGTERPDISGIRGTEGAIIARDGTIYYSQARAVGRLAPGGTPENTWVSLGASASTVWGMALDAANATLYVGSPSAGTIFSIDLTAGTPTATPFVTSAGAPNGLTIGPDGALYYSDFSAGRVMRVEATGGTPTRVTTTNIASANGVAFDTDGTLLVCSYSTGTLFRLTLTAGAETDRGTVATGLGNPDGVAVDANGDYWVTDNGGELLFVPAATGTPMSILTGVSSAASLDFGAGPLNCQDIYIASGGRMRRYEDGTVAGAAVPWH